MFVEVFLLIKEEYKTSSLHKWLSKANMLQSAHILSEIVMCYTLARNKYITEQILYNAGQCSCTSHYFTIVT